MDRAGSVRDILAVSKKLSAIREQIEQLNASVKNLRQQVAYSTIDWKVEEMQSATPTSDAFRVLAGDLEKLYLCSGESGDKSGTGIIVVATFYTIYGDRGWWCVLCDW